MDRVADQLRELWPALAFLLAAVPLADLLDRLGFFDAVAEVVVARRPDGVRVASLWWLAAATTAVLNLDTTVVLLTPLYLRLARRSGHDPTSLGLIPLLLAGLASCFLPVSNLTTLIAAERFGLDAADVVAHLGAPGVVAVVVGWVAYRRRHAVVLPATTPGVVDRRALRIGGAVVAALLVGFVVGPSWGIDPWMVALAADAVLAVVVGAVPWRTVPWGTALLVGAVAAVVTAVVPMSAARHLRADVGPAGVVGAGMLGALGAGLANNLPALLAGIEGVDHVSWASWAWLFGVTAGAVLVPTGALANLLWLRIVRDEGHPVRWRRFVVVVVPVAGPAFLAALAVLALERGVGLGP